MSDVQRDLLMYTDIYRCIQIVSEMYRYRQIWTDVYRCVKPHPDICIQKILDNRKHYVEKGEDVGGSSLLPSSMKMKMFCMRNDDAKMLVENY